MEELENKIRENFMNLVDIVKSISKKIIEVKNIESDIASSVIKSCKNEKCFFDYKIKPKYINTPINMNNYIQLKGNINPNIFMNNLCDILINEFGNDNCYIEPDKNKLKFNITFEEEEGEEKNDEEEEEITDEIKAELKKLGMAEEIKEEEEENNGLIIQIKLFQYSDGYILRFIQKEGDRKKFLDKFIEISKLIENLMSQIDVIQSIFGIIPLKQKKLKD